jgi:hypothetical protein
MYRIFYDPNSSYHEARRAFVYKKPATQTPARIATHRLSSVKVA